MRPDLTDNLIHFIRGETDEEAFEKLTQILDERLLRGGIDHIKGKYQCVCFSELSLALLRHGFVNKRGKGRYSKFGIMLPKTWLFELGGRPVIYQPDAEFDDLPESHRWRHVRFDPCNGVGFTWEREWRIQIDELSFDSSIEKVAFTQSRMGRPLATRSLARSKSQGASIFFDFRRRTRRGVSRGVSLAGALPGQQKENLSGDRSFRRLIATASTRFATSNPYTIARRRSSRFGLLQA